MNPQDALDRSAAETARETDGMPAVSGHTSLKAQQQIPLYHRTTDGGAEYLTDKYLQCANGHREGMFSGARFIVRVDGEPELQVDTVTAAAPLLLEACRALVRVAGLVPLFGIGGGKEALEKGIAAIAQATGYDED